VEKGYNYKDTMHKALVPLLATTAAVFDEQYVLLDNEL
jgi:hypothetical protein